ncbi:cysteine hydrolase family protein [Salipiger thiooxidans]|nr:cysteine hydrolase family protein [Salipiger thiooxidans]
MPILTNCTWPPSPPPPPEIRPGPRALIVIDMQRDFLEPGGFGETPGNDVSLLQAAVGPCKRALEAARNSGMLIVHTREGPVRRAACQDPTRPAEPEDRRSGPDVPHSRAWRARPRHRAGALSAGVRGGAGQAGKVAFHQTDLAQILVNHGIDTFTVCGVTT